MPSQLYSSLAESPSLSKQLRSASEQSKIHQRTDPARTGYSMSTFFSNIWRVLAKPKTCPTRLIMPRGINGCDQSEFPTL